MKPIVTVILAAGKGTRMKSKDPKVIMPLSGKTVLEHVIILAKAVESEDVVCVVGHDREKVKEKVGHLGVEFVVQEEQLGTGHAVGCAKDFFKDKDVLVLCGDAPLLKEQSLKKLVEVHRANRNKASLLTAHCDNPFGYGRIIRDDSNHLIKIVEQKDATEEELKVNEINSAIGIIDGNILLTMLSQLKNDNTQGEYYLTDVFSMLNKEVELVSCESIEEVLGINSRKQLAEAQKIFLDRKIEALFDNGVTILRPETVYIENDVVVGRDTIIESGVSLKGKTVIGEDCTIGANSNIENCIISDNVNVLNSTLVDSTVDSFTAVGPYAYLRPKSTIGKHVKVGDFVEIKNATIGDHTKISHLTYVGDAHVGERCNIGCGVVFVNYDGSKKHITNIGDDVFVGCNVNLIAPVKINDKAYIAAGSTITDEVPSEALAIARSRQVVKENWETKFSKKK